MKIVILHSDIARNATADELDVMVQVETVAEVLAGQGHALQVIPMSLDMESLGQRLQSEAPDLVFNLVETLAGSGRLIHVAPALLDLLQMPYTGSATEAIFLTSNKLLAKHLLKAHGIATPAWVSDQDGKCPGATVTASYIVKSVWEHASIGLDDSSLVAAADPRLLTETMRLQAARLGGSCFAEAYIDGREFNLSLLAGPDGPEVLPPAEILFDRLPPEKPKVLDYRAKWAIESFEYQHTPRCFDFAAKDLPLLRCLRDLALQCWRVFALRGYARVDFRIDAAGRPWVLEINTNPCLAPDAGFYAACRQAGYGMREILGRIVRDAEP